MSPAADVFALPLTGSWLLVAPLHGVTARVNESALTALSAGKLSDELSSQLGDIFQTMSVPQPRSGEFSPRFLGIIPTRSCNMDCVYCNFGASAASANKLDPKRAVAAIRWMADLAARQGRPNLDVHLFGGEPLLYEDMVEIVAHTTRVAAAERDLEPVLEVVTNGACSVPLAQFAADYFTTISLSFDGPKEYHNQHRRLRGGAGSFENVERTARIFAEGAADLILRACVSEKNVDALTSIVQWMAAEFNPKAIDFEPLRPSARSRAEGLRPPDPYLFARAFLEARQAIVGHLTEVKYSAAIRDQPRISFCPLGNDAVILETNGNLHACYMEESSWKGMDLHLGNISAEGEVTIHDHAVANVRAMAVPGPRCRDCFCRFWCAGGCHVDAADKTEDVDAFCVQTRLITAACLLEELGEAPEARRLLSDCSAAARLARRDSDRLEAAQ